MSATNVVTGSQISFLWGNTPQTLTLYGSTIPLLMLTTFFVGLRIYVRGFMTKTFGISDWLILPAYLLFIALCACGIVMGEILLHEDLSKSYPLLSKLTMADVLLITMDQIFTKLSVAAYFLRIVREPWQRAVIIASVSVFVFLGITFGFLALFDCSIPTVVGIVPKHCNTTLHVTVPLNYLLVCLNATVDWIFVGASISMIRNLQRMHSKEVLCVCFLVFLATSASIISLARIPYVPSGVHRAIDIHHAVIFKILSVAEAGVAIMTVSLATLHPLFRGCLNRKSKTRRLPRIQEQGHLPAIPEKEAQTTVEELTSQSLSLGRIGVLPTIPDTELGTMIEERPLAPRHESV